MALLANSAFISSASEADWTPSKIFGAAVDARARDRNSLMRDSTKPRQCSLVASIVLDIAYQPLPPVLVYATLGSPATDLDSAPAITGSSDHVVRISNSSRVAPGNAYRGQNLLYFAEARRLVGMLQEPIFVQPPLHGFQADRLFFPPFGHNGQIVEVFHESSILPRRDNDGGALPTTVNHVLFSRHAHRAPPLDCSRATMPVLLPIACPR